MHRIKYTQKHCQGTPAHTAIPWDWLGMLLSHCSSYFPHRGLKVQVCQRPGEGMGIRRENSLCTPKTAALQQAGEPKSWQSLNHTCRLSTTCTVFKGQGNRELEQLKNLHGSVYQCLSSTTPELQQLLWTAAIIPPNYLLENKPHHCPSWDLRVRGRKGECTHWNH